MLGQVVYIKDRFYKFESKSQPGDLDLVNRDKCISKIVFTSLKANHNMAYTAQVLLLVYIKDRFYKFESKSQR